MRDKPTTNMERLRVQPNQVPRSQPGQLFGCYYWPEKAAFITSGKMGGWWRVTVSKRDRPATDDELARVRACFWHDGERVTIHEGDGYRRQWKRYGYRRHLTCRLADNQ